MRQAKWMIIPLIIAVNVGMVTAQEVLTIAPDGNVGINNPSPSTELDVTGDVSVDGTTTTTRMTVQDVLTVNGTITTTGPIAAPNLPNLVFADTALLNDPAIVRTPARGGRTTIPLPDGYTSANTIIIGAKAQQPAPDESVWVPLPYSGAGYINIVLSGTNILIENRWADSFYDNRPAEILLVRIGS